jgi:hypothetical protein
MSQYFHAADFLAALSDAPTVDSVDEVVEVFYDLMTAQPTLIRSPHLWGDAVDLRPMEDMAAIPTHTGQRVLDWIRACSDTVDFRTREGKKLRRWHWACTRSVEV